MSKQEMIKSVSRKLQNYFELKRLEDGFDLSGPECPRLDHPPLKTRSVLSYNGMHDRSLKHYFQSDKIRTALTKFDLKSDDENKERTREIKKSLKRYMQRYQNPALIDAFDIYALNGQQGRTPTRPSTAHERRMGCNSARPGMTLRFAPPSNVSKAESERLLKMASQILAATESVDTSEPEKERPKPRPKSSKPKVIPRLLVSFDFYFEISKFPR
jgi:hypothetical protein